MTTTMIVILAAAPYGGTFSTEASVPKRRQLLREIAAGREMFPIDFVERTIRATDSVLLREAMSGLCCAEIAPMTGCRR